MLMLSLSLLLHTLKVFVFVDVIGVVVTAYSKVFVFVDIIVVVVTAYSKSKVFVLLYYYSVVCVFLTKFWPKFASIF